MPAYPVLFSGARFYWGAKARAPVPPRRRAGQVATAAALGVGSPTGADGRYDDPYVARPGSLGRATQVAGMNRK